MEITIKIAGASPDGVRRLTTTNWSGVCVVLSRNQIDSALGSAELARAGVYILAGPAEIETESKSPRLVSKIYIGKSETLDERLRSHHAAKISGQRLLLFIAATMTFTVVRSLNWKRY